MGPPEDPDQLCGACLGPTTIDPLGGGGTDSLSIVGWTGKGMSGGITPGGSGGWYAAMTAAGGWPAGNDEVPQVCCPIPTPYVTREDKFEYVGERHARITSLTLSGSIYPCQMLHEVDPRNVVGGGANDLYSDPSLGVDAFTGIADFLLIGGPRVWENPVALLEVSGP